MPQNEIRLCEVPKYHNELNQKVHQVRLNYGKKVNMFVQLKDKCHKHAKNKKLFLEWSWIKPKEVWMKDALIVDVNVQRYS